MAGKRFSPKDWRRINAELDQYPARYGLPERVYGSAVLASFNIRKLGAEGKRDDHTWRFLGKLCGHFDLLAVQEVMDDLSGLHRLRAEMGPEYKVIVSDTTGAFPGSPGLNERLAFIYRDDIVRRGDIVSDVTYDRSKILEILSTNVDSVEQAIKSLKEQEKPSARKAGKRRWRRKKKKKKRRAKKPAPKKLELPFFFSFIRQPFSVGFRIVGHPGLQPYEFMAVNAHLIYGELKDRKREFDALMEWIIARQKRTDGSLFPGTILLGDLNLDFDNPETDIGDINKYLKEFSTRAGQVVRVKFPFLERHPRDGRILRTNARLKQTFDHIGLFYRASRIPAGIQKRAMGSDPRGPDYGVVNFVNLFCKAIKNKPFYALPKKQRKGFYARFEHSVSDHMPIWLRIPLPDA